MTPEERAALISNKIWYWMPVRWTDGMDWWEITRVEVMGNEEEGGAGVWVRKNESDPVLISFSNEELYGENSIPPEVARARVMV